MGKKIITEQEALDSMFSFIRKNLHGLDDIKEEQNRFYGKKGGMDFILDVVKAPIIPSDSFLDYVNGNSKKGVATGIVMLRSTTQYNGKLLKQLEYKIDGKNFFWNNKKNLTKFEQDVLRLYGNPSAYYNPQEDIIQIVHTKRFKKIPKYLASKSPEELTKNKSLRRTLHIEESRIDSWSKIWFSAAFKDSFTLDFYKRRNKTLARIAPYDP